MRGEAAPKSAQRDEAAAPAEAAQATEAAPAEGEVAATSAEDAVYTDNTQIATDQLGIFGQAQRLLDEGRDGHVWPVHAADCDGDHDHHAVHAARRDRQIGANSAVRLAAGRDGRSDARQRPDPRRDDGHGGRLPDGALQRLLRRRAD